MLQRWRSGYVCTVPYNHSRQVDKKFLAAEKEYTTARSNEQKVPRSVRGGERKVRADAKSLADAFPTVRPVGVRARSGRRTWAAHKTARRRCRPTNGSSRAGRTRISPRYCGVRSHALRFLLRSADANHAHAYCWSPHRQFEKAAQKAQKEADAAGASASQRIAKRGGTAYSLP